MASINIRNKGARGEREVIALLQPVVNRVFEAIGKVPPVLQRNTLQSHLGGYDIVGLDWLAIEVKLHETENLTSWWAQTLRQTKEGTEPVLIWRKSRSKWQVKTLVKLSLGKNYFMRTPVVMTMDDFLLYVEARLKVSFLSKKNVQAT